MKSSLKESLVNRKIQNNIQKKLIVKKFKSITNYLRKGSNIKKRYVNFFYD